MPVAITDTVEYAVDVMFKEIDGEAVLLHLDAAEYFGLDPVGTRIWALIGERRGKVSLMLEGIVAEFDVTAEEAERDLLTLLEQLQAAQLIRLVEAPTK